VCGLDLSAAQIRVGGVAAVPSERSGEVRPVKYFLEDGIIKSESWQSNQS
jgi:hypothetical protein